MSQISPVSAPSSEDVFRAERRRAPEKKRPFVDEDLSLNGREPGHPRPVSWHPSTPVEPPLSSTQLRPIGVESILNPPAKAPPGSAPTTQVPWEGAGKTPISISRNEKSSNHYTCLTISSSQETSPTTPISTFSHFGRSSPVVATASAPSGPPAYLPPAPHTTMEPASRLPSVMGGHRSTGGEPVAVAGSQAENPPYPGMIPCILDLKSGSSSQAEKRKANSDASRRFRNRKRNEMQMEQKITAQQDEIRKQTEALQRQVQEIRILMQERDFYRSERNFYREHVSRLVPAGQLPTRPASPRALRPSFEKTSSDRDHQTWSNTDTTQRVVDTAGVPAPASTARAAGNWTSRGTLADEQQARSLPQFPGSWTRT
ncbi:hypothetical protein BBP40_008112 [Aspergillus hancockii]|nr:hypothetical protein BBP40_008112 [Aspergillus hancockii]